MNQTLQKAQVIFSYKEASLHFNDKASIAITSTIVLLACIAGYKLLKS